MWVAKIRLKHDCIIGNRCEKFGIMMQSLDLNEEKENGKVLTSSMHTLIGDKNQINKFVRDLRKDEKTEYIEFNGNTLFLIETAKKKPVSHFNRRMFFVKPMVLDTGGYEHWEIASHKREELTDFMDKVEPIVDEFELLSLKNTPLQSIYFPKVMPELTDPQQRALEIAVEKGYYSSPKKASLRELAKKMDVSLATYQKHLQKAESKIIPDALSLTK